MGILDDAIKEHLDLKRQHGAAEDELKKLEDDAFGAAERPGEEESVADPLAEAPTEFMAQPDLEGEEDAPRSRRPDVADLQEAPPPAEPEAVEPAPEPEPPAEEEAPAMEHEAISEPPEAEAAAPEPPEVEPEISSGPSTEEREAIAEQPTEMFDVEAELGGAAAEQAPAEPEAEQPAQGEEDEYEEDDDFWDEKRLSDELDQALEAPSEPEDEEALYEDAATEAEEPEADEPQAGRAGPTRAPHPAGRGGGRAGGDAGLPRGGPGGRPALVRAEAPEGLRLRRLSPLASGPDPAYTLKRGAIAQLEERRLCKAEAAGSSPAGSTSLAGRGPAFRQILVRVVAASHQRP